MYPAGVVGDVPGGLGPAVHDAYPVKPGDTLTARVAGAGSRYTLSLRSSEGWTFSSAQSGTLADGSAECVAEAPQICCLGVFCKGANLTNFGTASFTAAGAATGSGDLPISSFPAAGGPHEITMVSTTGSTRAQPGPLLSGGTGFADTWKGS